MKNKLKFYNVSGSVVNSVYYYGHKLKIDYDYQGIEGCFREIWSTEKD